MVLFNYVDKGILSSVIIELPSLSQLRCQRFSVFCNNLIAWSFFNNSAIGILFYVII